MAEHIATLTVTMTDAQRDDNENELDRIVGHLREFAAIMSVRVSPLTVASDPGVTPQQALRLRELLNDHEAGGAQISLRPFDLPDGYVYVVVQRPGGPDFHCGISPEGEGSS